MIKLNYKNVDAQVIGQENGLNLARNEICLRERRLFRRSRLGVRADDRETNAYILR